MRLFPVAFGEFAADLAEGFGQRFCFMDGCTARSATADGDTSGLPPRVAAGTALISGLHRPIM